MRWLARVWVEHHYSCWVVGMVVGFLIGVGIAEYHVRLYAGAAS